MARFGLVGGTYQSEAVNADAQRSMNWYPEIIESGDGASQMGMYPSPGIYPYVGGSNLTIPVRGIYEFNNSVYFASDQLYYIDPTTGVHSTGLVPNSATTPSPVSMAANSAGQLLVCDTYNMWLWPIVTPTQAGVGFLAYVQGSASANTADHLIFTLTASAQWPVGSTVYFSGLTAHSSLNGLSAQVLASSTAGPITVETTVPVGWVNPYFAQAAETGLVSSAVSGKVGTNLPPGIFQIGFIDGYFIALAAGGGAGIGANSPIFYVSGFEDGNTWDASQAYQVSEYADNVQAMFVHLRQAWLFGNKSTLIYYNTGDPLVTFAPIDGAFLNVGIAAPWSIAELGQNLFWISADDRGVGVAVMATGYSPQRISNHCVEREWQTYSTISDARGYTFQDRGHGFYHVYFPTANKSWRFDINTGMWHEVGTIQDDGFTLGAHRSCCHTSVQATGYSQTIFPAVGFLHLVGDPKSNTIFRMDKSYLQDQFSSSPGTRNIPRMRRSPPIVNELEWMFHHKLRVHLETGLGPTPPLIGTAQGNVYFWLQDANGVIWQLSISDAGIWQATQTSGVSLTNYTFADIALLPYQLQCYALGVNTSGQPMVTLVPPPQGLSGYIQRLPLMTYPSALQTGLSVQNGNLMIDPPAQAMREPQLMLRWSDDGGHSWSNYYIRGAGMAGEFFKRVEWRQLGRSRGRVYEISTSDPIAWRIVDAYLDATDPQGQGYKPVQRYVHQVGKMA